MNVQQKKITHRNLQYIDNESQMFVRTIHLHLIAPTRRGRECPTNAAPCNHLINYYHRFIFRKTNYYNKNS